MKIVRLLSYLLLMSNNVSESFKPIHTPYWFNPKIHNFGNIGIGGKIHATSANFFTKMIDILAYNKTDIRKKFVVESIPLSYKVCDIGCGVGLSTHEGPHSVGVDTSPEMINVAKKTFPDKKFEVGNAEDFGNRNEYDVVTISFLFHEVPQEARIKIINNALKISKIGVIIIDISPQYKPSPQMLTGEPYILEYCKNINNDISKINYNVYNYEVAPGRANIWVINKLKNSFLANYKDVFQKNEENVI